MPGRKPHQAYDAFVEPIGRALSCITGEVLRPSHDARRPGAIRSVALPIGRDYIRLAGETGLMFMAQIEYELVETEDPERGRWKVRTRQYRYHVVAADHTEVLLFHWHPERSGNRTFPHLHVGSSQLTTDAVMSGSAHIPTGRVALEAVIRLLITEFKVPAKRDDWEAVLADGEDRFVRWRTWH